MNPGARWKGSMMWAWCKSTDSLHLCKTDPHFGAVSAAVTGAGKWMCVWVVGKGRQSVYKRILLYHIRLFLLENSGLISEQAQRALLFTPLLSISSMSNLQSTDWILAMLLFRPHFCWLHQGSVISFELSAYLMVRLRLGCREKVNICLVSEFKSQLLEGSAVGVPTLS